MNDMDVIKAIFSKLGDEKDEIIKNCIESNDASEIKDRLRSISSSISEKDVEELSKFFSSAVSLSDEDLASVVGGVSYLG